MCFIPPAEERGGGEFIFTNLQLRCCRLKGEAGASLYMYRAKGWETPQRGYWSRQTLSHQQAITIRVSSTTQWHAFCLSEEEIKCNIRQDTNLLSVYT